MATLKVKVLLSFLRLLIVDKILRGKLVISGVTSQAAKLPNLPFTVVQLTAANDDLDKKTQAAADGGKTAIKARNAAEKVWDNNFKATANYVNAVANGDALFISQCGFESSSEHSTTKQVPNQLVNLKGEAITNAPGNIAISSNTESNAKAYASIITSTNAVVDQVGDMIIVTVGNEKVYLVLDTHHKSVAHELPSGTELSLYGVAFNGTGVGQIAQAKNVKAL